MKFSIIIPTFNRCDLLARTLPTVLSQQFPPEEFEVIVVVDGATDGTREFLKTVQSAARLRVLEQANQGQASARNSGLREAVGTWVLFLDDDIVCPKTLLIEHAAAHAGEDSVVVAGPVLLSPESPPGLALDLRVKETETWVEEVGHEKYLTGFKNIIVGPNVSVPRQALNSVGGFDERLQRAFEDYDLAFRLKKRGFSFRLCPEATTSEIYTKSIREVVFDDAVRFGKNQALLCRLHPEFRPFSVFRHLADASVVKRFALRLAASAPFSPASVLQPLSRLAERFRNNTWVRGVGVSLLHAQIFFQVIRSGVAATGSWRNAVREYGLRLPVLLYHRIGSPPTGLWPLATVTPDRFARHLKWLARFGYSGIRPSDWLDWVTKGKALPRKPILLTFDDGYSELTELALPLLFQKGYGAGVFVVTGLLGKTNAWDEEKGYSPLRLMQARDISEWVEKGIEFGAHSRTHPDLTRLSEKALDGEIEGSGRDLEAILGHSVASFAYPYGLYDDHARRQVRRSYGMAFTTTKGVNSLRTDLHELKRTAVDPADSGIDIFFRARWGWSPWRVMMNRLQGQSSQVPRRSRRTVR